MNAIAQSSTESEVQPRAADISRTTRPFYWSVWRELWENHSIYIAPLIVGAVEVLGFGVSAIGLAERRRVLLLLPDAAKQRAGIETPYDIAAVLMIFTVFV